MDNKVKDITEDADSIINEFEKVYDQYYEGINRLTKEVRSARKSNDYEALYHLRSKFVEGDMLLAPNIKTDSLEFYLTCQINRESCEDDTMLKYCKSVGRGSEHEYRTMEEAKTAAKAHCRELKILENKARVSYEKAKTLERNLERLDRSIAAHLRRYEKLI